MQTATRAVLVEDDEDIRVAAEKALWGSGYEVFSAGDGESGLQLVKGKRPDLVILDLMMPRKHGFTVYPAVRSDSSLRHIAILSLRGTGRDLKDSFTGQMDASYFPVSLKDMKSKLNFVELDGRVQVRRAEISSLFLNHPGVAVGFRIEVGSQCLVYVTHHEVYPRMSGKHEQQEKLDRQHNEFARKADPYISDAQYTEEEYAARQGWGDITWKDALESAHEGGVTQLALFHHDPGHDDSMMDGIVSSARQYMNKRGMHFDCFAAAGKMLVRI